MRQDIIDNIEVSGAFFLLEIVLLPLILKRFEDNRWRPMREQLIDELVDFHRIMVDAVRQVYISLLQTFLSEHIIGRENISPIDIDGISNRIIGRQEEIRRFIDICGTSVEPSMAKAIVDLLYLPKLQYPHLRALNERLHDLVYFSESSGPMIYVEGGFRASLHTDVHAIEMTLDLELKDLRVVVAGSSMTRRFRREVISRIDALADDQIFIEAAAPGLIELLTHRTHYHFNNRKYDSVAEWLNCHPIPHNQALAIVAFGDEDLISEMHA